MLRNYRKPLVLAAPKIGLKHPKAVSSVADFAPQTRFKPTISKDFGSSDIKRLVLCSGKVAFDIEDTLTKQQESLGHGVRVVRLEELAPFPVNDLRAYMGSLGKNTQVTWVQEESMN